MKLALAIDPGDHATGIAVFVHPDLPTPAGPHGGYALVASCSVRVADQVEALAFLRTFFQQSSLDLAAVATNPGACWEVVIERDTCPRSRAAIESLAACRRTWRTALRRLAVPEHCIRELAPQTWQGPSGLLGRMARLMGGTKAASVILARETVGRARGTGAIDQDLDADEADAVNMGCWWLREGGLAGHAARVVGQGAGGAKGSRGKKGGGWTAEAAAEVVARNGRVAG